MRRTDQSAAVVGSTIYGDGVFLILVGSWRGASKNRDYAASRRMYERHAADAQRAENTQAKTKQKNKQRSSETTDISLSTLPTSRVAS